MADAYKAWVGSGFFTCPVCGGEFYIPPYVTEWTYKVSQERGRKLPVCSYKCFSKEQKRKTEIKGERYLNRYKKVSKR